MIFLIDDNKLFNIKPENLVAIECKQDILIFYYTGFNLSTDRVISNLEIKKYIKFLKSIESRYEFITKDEFESELINFIDKCEAGGKNESK